MAHPGGLDVAGELSFRNVPDYEAPADSGRDNVYDFSVRASDGRNYSYLEVTVTVNDVNEALAITTTSKTSFTYRENGTATIYTFSATDPEGADITWSTGGADGDDFTIVADSRGRGVLTFASPPDFENPADSGGDNVYEVTVCPVSRFLLTFSGFRFEGWVGQVGVEGALPGERFVGADRVVFVDEVGDTVGEVDALGISSR